MSRSSEDEAFLNRSHDRALEFILSAVSERRQLRRDWRDPLHDAVQEMDKIVRRQAHPDDVSRARLAIDCLLGLWLSDAERDELSGGPNV